MMPTRILIADDHPLSRHGLKTMIESDPAFMVAGEAADGEDTIQLIQQCQPDVAVLDISMPKVDGLDVARWIQKLQLQVKVLFITVHAGEDLFREALRLGARGYLLKDTSLLEILNGLRAVRDGQYFVPPDLMHLLIEKPENAPKGNESSGLPLLTNTERRVLQLIEAGKSSKEIAAELFITYKTVENHRTNISQKLGLSGPYALMRYALQNRAES